MQERKDIHEIVSRSYLYSVALRLAVVVLCGAVLASVVIWLYFRVTPPGSYAENFRMLSRLKGEIVYAAVIIYAANALFIITGIVIVALLYTQRISGPVHRLEMFVRRAAAGNPAEHVKLRQFDPIHPLADDINAMVSSYCAIASQLEAKAGELFSASYAMRDSAAPLSREELGKALFNISEKAAELRNILHDTRL